jgi:hypothetical protein
LIAPRYARPGEEVEIAVVLAGENGAERTSRVKYRVPVGLPAGLLNLTVADAASTNMLEFQGIMGIPARSPEQVLDFLSGLRSNTQAYLRVWRGGTSFTVEGHDVPEPPASAALVLNRAQPAGTINTTRGSKLAELEIPGGGNVVTGSKTIQLEVRE